MKVFIISVLALALVNLSQTAQVLTSPLLTNWGVWGQMESCPPGSKVISVQVKSDAWNVGDILWDDTCMNGVKFMCGDPKSGDISSMITSSVGEWGKWKNVFKCNGNGYMVGFMIRSVEENTAVVDESATNNLRILCSGSPDGFIELDGEQWGEWTNPRICDSHEYVCGLQTQVEPSQGALTDDTSLNNIKVQCCDLSKEELIEYGIKNASMI